MGERYGYHKIIHKQKRHSSISPDLAGHLQENKSRYGSLTVIYGRARGNKLKDIKRSFKTACRRAGIHNLRIKDLRHTFASHFTMKTADLKSLQEILGHTNIKTTMRYSHLCEAHKAEQMQKMNGLTSGSRAHVERFGHFPQKKNLPESDKSLK